MKIRGLARLVVLGAVLFLACTGCGTARPDHVSPHASFESAALTIGDIVEKSFDKDPEERHIVIVMDRHATTSSFMRLRPQLREVQRSNRMLVEYLVAHDYSLLGCEKELGELKETEKTAKQFAAARGRLDPVDELDHFSVYQPIRFKLMFEGRLAVFGVEDPELYAADVARLKTMLEASRIAKRYDMEDEKRKEAERTMRQMTAELSDNIIRRGVRAAQNLCDLMQETGRKKAILLIGGAHCRAAADIFKNRKIPYVIFRPSNYEAATTDGLPSEDENAPF